MRRGTLAGLIAGGVVAGFILLIYLFAAYLWPVLPVWANIVIAIALSLGFIFSPMALLLKLDRPQNSPQRHEGHKGTRS